MTQDEIIEMADKAHGAITDTWWDMDVASLERFAKLVAQHEREACAQLCEDKVTLLAWVTFAQAIRARGQA